MSSDPLTSTLETPQVEETSALPPEKELQAEEALAPHVCKMVNIPAGGIPLEEIERRAIFEALKLSDWVQKDAAELLSISPRVMNYKIKTLRIDYPRPARTK
jgi:transcriptional regulator with GAF, ATPase, and Fis domain